MTRRYGRAAKGQRVSDAVPKNFGRNVTIPGALSCHGLDAVMTVDGATDAAVFRAYVEYVLAPTLKPGDVVRRRFHSGIGHRGLVRYGHHLAPSPP